MTHMAGRMGGSGRGGGVRLICVNETCSLTKILHIFWFWKILGLYMHTSYKTKKCAASAHIWNLNATYSEWNFSKSIPLKSTFDNISRNYLIQNLFLGIWCRVHLCDLLLLAGYFLIYQNPTVMLKMSSKYNPKKFVLPKICSGIQS